MTLAADLRARATPARLLWLDAGQPALTKPTRATTERCYLCGLPSPTGTGVRVRDALGPGFTDHDRARCRTSTHLCPPCVYALGGKPPDTFRLWSVVYREDRRAAPSNPKAVYPHGPHTSCQSKADVSQIVDILLDPPALGRWMVAVAESGQKHTIPWATVNEGPEAWTIRYETIDVTSTPREFAALLYHACALLAAGFIREDIETLDPHPSKLAKHGVGVWREHAEPLKQWRRSAVLALAINLTRKDSYGELRDRARARAAADGRAAGARDDGEREHGEDPAGRLVAARQDGARVGGRPGGELGRARGDDGTPTPDRCDPHRVEQGDLFGRRP